MAWTSLEDEACTILRTHLLNQSQEWKEAFYAGLVRTVHPHARWTWEQNNWDTHLGITAVTTYGDEHLESNLKLALIGEMLGLGPQEYCVIDTGLPDFEDRLYRILKHLPARKICLYPPRTHLGGPFTQLPWNTIGRLICARPSPEDNEVVQLAHAMQDGEISMDVESFIVYDDEPNLPAWLAYLQRVRRWGLNV